jgi:hypothetical protein
MPKKAEEKKLLFSFHVNVYENNIDVKINNWAAANPGKLQRTYNAIQDEWNRLRRAALQKRREQEHDSLVKNREEKPELEEGQVPSEERKNG